MRVFLSYSEKDQAVVDKIAGALRKGNVETWRADKDISAGSDLSLSIRDAMKSSDIIMAVLSKESIANVNVLSEIYWALAQSYEDQPQKFVPILIDRHVDLPPMLSNLKYYYVGRSSNIESEISSLLPQLFAISQRQTDYSTTKQAQIEHIDSQRKALDQLAIEAEARKAKRSTLVSISIASFSVFAAGISFLFTSRLLADFRFDLNSLFVGLIVGLLVGSSVSALVLAIYRKRREGNNNG